MGKYSAQLLNAQEEPPPQGSGKYSGQLLGSSEAVAQPAPQPERSWWQGIKESVAGKRDPRFQDLPTVYSQDPSIRDEVNAAEVFGASDAQRADVIRNALGERFVGLEKDANNYDVLSFKDAQGAVQRGYVNAPGLDAEDVARGIKGALPYVATGGAAGAAARGAGIGLNALAQGLTAGATSIGGDIAQMPLGSEQGVELEKAGVTAAGGAAVVPVAAAASALWQRFVTVPGLFDKAAGKLTDKGLEAARRAGIDPADIESTIAQKFAREYARTGDAKASMLQAQSANGGIPVTRGQMTKRPDLLDQEEKMRRNLYGDKARETIADFDQQQRQAIRESALGSPMPASVRQQIKAQGGQVVDGIGERLAPHRAPGADLNDLNPQTLGESIRSGVQDARQGARAAENQIWEGTRDLAATKGALDTLPDAINSRLTNVVVDESITPMAAKMGKELEAFVEGKVPTTSAGIIKGTGVQSVDQMRRRLGAMVSSAQGEDRRAASTIYDAFNDWIGDSAQNALLAGDQAAAIKIVQARGFTREVRSLFNPKSADGAASPAAQRIAKILDDQKADSGESVINALLGAGTGNLTGANGASLALRNIKMALDRFAPQTGKQAWDDIRLAYWSRLNLDKAGNLAGPQAIQGNIERAFQNQRSIIDALYTPEEQKQIRAYLAQIRNVAYKPPNASGSGYTAATAIKEFGMSLLNAFGLGRVAAGALQYSGVPNAYYGQLAKSAVNPVAKSAPNALAPFATGAVSADARQR